ncbi:cupin domain-containing protein [Aquibacillus halophilus]|uniref:Cupin domain-containing protein n=1 Tax=Aquibacillus halophilus TaxID=930132 RepID=A0A6A8D6R8_9BACI|nr:sugar phosphate nucleotidyltransferase [Aquibacillus halophilus]MRH41304.1 cupin domain-containing protein [Aquibacillus halophilus]
MRLVLLSGGSGKRLWPLSNDSRSKQFLKVLSNSEGEFESMVQRVWGQLRKNDLVNKAIIATSKSQVDMITNQLGSNVTIVTEPERRDTFPAIALAAVYLYSIEKCSLDEVVGMLPVDPYVEDKFFQRVKDLELALNSTNAELALIGINPTYPSEKYGYIVPKLSDDGNILKVDYFKEKPDIKTAEELMSKQALWNSGVFAFKLEYIIKMLEDKGLPTQYNELLEQYHTLHKNSFDYEVVEKANDIVALSYDGYWKDLGTWNTLTEEMGSQQIGKGIMGEGVDNSYIINELDIPIVLLGIKNAVVAASPDGILVTDSETSPKIKEYVDRISDRPMYEERRWGWYKVLDYVKYPEGNEVLTKRIGIRAGKNLSYQVHYKRSEIWTIVKGQGVYIVNNKLSHIREGDVVHIPLGMKHAIKAATDMEIIEVQTGSELIEEDIIRLTTNWADIEQLARI